VTFSQPFSDPRNQGIRKEKKLVHILSSVSYGK
jgi:hypothetical protein